MAKGFNLFGGLFSRRNQAPRGAEQIQQEKELLARVQRDIANSGPAAESLLAESINQLNDLWGLPALQWKPGPANSPDRELAVSFSSHQIGSITWDPDSPPNEDQLETLRILSGLAGPYLMPAPTAALTPMEHWHEERIDEATGLLNQRSLVALLQDVLNQPTSYSGLSSALVVMQLQESAKLYKELGPEKYISKIKCLGELLQKGFGLRSSAARIEDDLFVILIPSLHSPEKAAQLSQSCRKKAEETLGLELCVGIAPQVDSYEDSIIWINDAKTALKQAKDGGGQQAFLSQTMQMHSIAMWRMESDLELALKGRQLETWFQPIVRLKDKTIAGYEALCRWTHPDRGPISPAEFIPVAENDGGLILEIGNFTLTESCQTLANIMERDGNDGLFMSVNLSAVQLLKDRRLTHYLEDALRKANIPPQQLKLEVTETAMMHQREQAIEALNRIKETGAQISLDDFGTGYSSLAYLKDFPISTLKIDRAFVSNVDSNKESQSILQTIAELGKSLDLDIVAEGIETEGELEILMALGCEYGQGWLFSKPLPASDL